MQIISEGCCCSGSEIDSENDSDSELHIRQQQIIYKTYTVIKHIFLLHACLQLSCYSTHVFNSSFSVQFV